MVTISVETGFWTRERLRDALVVVLSLVTGAVDAIGLLRLGGVFTSVMTGNMVFLGVSTATHDASLALHTGDAFIGYVLGSFLGARVAGHAEDETHPWPRPIVATLLFEFAVMAAFTAWWELVGAAPSSATTYVLLAMNAGALGIQSAAVLRFGINGLSTTYMTGTLTQFIASLTKRREAFQARSALILLGIIAGSAIGALSAVYSPRFAPFVPTLLLGFVVLGSWWVFHRD